MIVAVLPVRMVQVPLYHVVGVISVQHRLVPAIWPVNMAGFMSATLVVRCAAVLVGRPDRQPVFVHMISMHMVQMTVVKIIDVAVVPDCGVAAVRAVGMCVSFLLHAGLRHRVSFAESRSQGGFGGSGNGRDAVSIRCLDSRLV